jgi:hypothetical protein
MVDAVSKARGYDYEIDSQGQGVFNKKRVTNEALTTDWIVDPQKKQCVRSWTAVTGELTGSACRLRTAEKRC